MPGGDHAPPGSRLGYLDQVASQVEDFLRLRGADLSCALCGRRADRFRLGPGHGVLCVECAPEGGGHWYTLDRLFTDFLHCLTALRNCSVALLGFHVLEMMAPPGGDTGDAGPVVRAAPLGELGRLTDDCLYLVGLVKRLRGTAATCGYTLPAEELFPFSLRESRPPV